MRIIQNPPCKECSPSENKKHCSNWWWLFSNDWMERWGKEELV